MQSLDHVLILLIFNRPWCSAEEVDQVDKDGGAFA